MTDATARIKNLSIALEAIHTVSWRGNKPDPYRLEAKLELCLKYEIDQLEKEQVEPPPPARPAEPTSFEPTIDS